MCFEWLYFSGKNRFIQNIFDLHKKNLLVLKIYLKTAPFGLFFREIFCFSNRFVCQCSENIVRFKPVLN